MEDGGPSNIIQQRQRRWQRRASDGADWDYRRRIHRRSDDDAKPRRRGSLPSTLQSAVQNEPLLHREPWRLTEDVKDRLAAAGRASATTFATLALLIFTEQEVLPVGWIGNVVALSTLGPTLGATIVSVKNVFVPMVPVAMASWGISYLLGILSTTLYSILLPFVIVLGCLVITLCPWPFLRTKNLMLVIFYLLVASPLSMRDDLNAAEIQREALLFVPGVLGTCCVGLAVAVSVHVFLIPFPRSTTASRSARILLRRLNNESNMFLRSVAQYAQNIGVRTKIATQQRTLIEFYVAKRQQTLERLQASFPAVKVERCSSLDTDIFDSILKCSMNQQKHAQLVELATTQQFLGEGFTTQSSTLQDVKSAFATNLGNVIEELVGSYETTSEIAISCGTLQGDEESPDRLNTCMDNYRVGMRGAICDAEEMLVNDDAASRAAAGPMTRQRVAFFGVYNFVFELSDTMKSIRDARDTEPKPKGLRLRFKTQSLQLMNALKLPWLWGDLSKRRMAAKTSLALSLASLWVSIPYLRNEVAYPNSIWVGITVSTVSLESTGSSVTKAMGRLWGTLMAGGFALLIDKLLGTYGHPVGQLVLMTLFTFAAIYAGTNSDSPYAARYAATSLGSILYGSFENDMTVSEYVPQRAMLIFTGVLIALFVEMLVFPRSSRTIVQANALQFFEDLEHVLQSSRDALARMHNVSVDEEKDSKNLLSEDDPLWMLREGNKNVSLSDDFMAACGAVQKTQALAQKELKPGIAEPVLGGIRLHVGGYEALLSEQKKIVSQLDLLTITMKSLAGYFETLPEDHPVRSLQWPDFLSSCIGQTTEQLSKCIDGLLEVFPHGLLRPGASHMSSIIRAVSVFRGFENAVLGIHTELENRHANFMKMLVAGDYNKAYVPGLRLTIALAKSAVLTIGTSLKTCGTAIETVVKNFPEDEMKVSNVSGLPSVSDDDDTTKDQQA